ncbi:MAG TPA: DUF308 domain-containing protein [Bdellovibrionota bacterium]|jgi:uncharacterized membrane protein HdeD (DUF308 family)
MTNYFDRWFRVREPTSTEISALSANWGWIMATGAICAFLGLLAFSTPVATTLGLTVLLASLLLVSGVVQFVQAIRLRHRHGTLLRFAQSLFSMVAGVLMFRYPGGGMVGIALVLSYYFLLNSASQWAMAVSMRPHRGWWWGIVGAVCSLIMGIYMIWTLPISALWVPGVVLGIELIAMGVSMIAFSLAIREPERISHRPLQSAS